MIISKRHRRNARAIAAVAGAAAVTMLAAGCAGAASGSGDGHKPTALRMLYTTNEANSAAIAAMVPTFEKKFGIKLEIDNSPYNALQQKVFAEFASGSDHYDIVVVDTPWAPALVKALEPLSSYIGKKSLNKGLDPALSDYIPKVLYDTSVYNTKSPSARFPEPTAAPDIAQITSKGFDVYGLPIQSNAAIMAYRADLFEDPAQQADFKKKYGRDLAVPKTWDEYAQVAEFFTQPDKNLYGTTITGEVGGAATGDFKTLLASFGGNGTLVNEDKMTPAFNTPEGVQALTYYAELAKSGHVPPGSTSAGWDAASDSFTNGLTAMTINFHDFKLADSVVAKGGKIGYAPTPRGASYGPHFGTWMLSVNSKSKNKDWAYQAISWLTASEQQIAMTKEALHPTRQSVYEQVGKGDPLADFYDTLGASLAEGVGRARIPNWTEVEHEVGVAVNNAATGTATPKEALAEADKKVSELLKADR